MKTFREYLEIIQEGKKPEKLTNFGDPKITKESFAFFIGTKKYNGTLLDIKEQVEDKLKKGYSVSSITINGISKKDFKDYLEANPNDYIGVTFLKANIEESPKNVVAITFTNYQPDLMNDIISHKTRKKYDDMEREDNEDNPASYS
jgi:CTP-dependent riboflavin kinase